jgi:hypothetical protein
MIGVHQVTRRFGPVTAVDGLIFTVRPGRVTRFRAGRRHPRDHPPRCLTRERMAGQVNPLIRPRACFKS